MRRPRHGLSFGRGLNLCSGRLPYTIAKSEPDYSARVIYKGSGTVQIPYTEGLFIDYRHFDAVRVPLVLCALNSRD